MPTIILSLTENPLREQITRQLTPSGEELGGPDLPTPMKVYKGVQLSQVRVGLGVFAVF